MIGGVIATILKGRHAVKTRSNPPYAIITPLLLFVLLLLTWGIFAFLPLAWTGWAPATCLGTGGCFCEAIHPGALAQPANSWSSLAFCLPGLFVLFQPASKTTFTKTKERI